MNGNMLIWQIEIVNFFLKNHNYKIVKLIDRTNHVNNDFWLINKENKKYSIIRISTDTLPISEEKIEIIELYSNELKKVVNTQSEVLSIYVSKYEGELDNNTVSITDEFYNGEDLSTYFPNLKTVLKPITDKDSELIRVSKELQKLSQPKRISMFDKNKKIPPVTLSLIIICSLIYILTNIFSTYFNSVSESAIMLGAYYKIFIMAGEYFRFLTVGLTHGNFLHLAMNMIALLNLGRILEPIYGSKKFLIVIIGSTITGSALTYIISNAVLVTGLSGGLYGLLGTLLVYYFNSGIIKNPILRNNIMSILMINLMISFLPGIALYGHLGGFVFGVLIGILFTNNNSWKTLRQNTLISLSILALVMVYMVLTVSKASLEGIFIQTDINLLNAYKDIGLNKYSNYLQKKLIEIYKYY